MIVHIQNNLKYYSFPSLLDDHMGHGIFTRQGGVSKGMYQSLNLGGTNGDSREAVWENHQRVFEAISRPFSSRFDVWQVHGKQIICTDKPRADHQKHLPADGIFTDNPDVTLIMRFADCVPLLFFDPIKKVVGIVHAGWQGTLLKIGAEAVRKIIEKYGCQPEDLKVGIGPSICREYYQVGKEVVSKFETEFGDAHSAFIEKSSKGYHLDLWQANKMILESVGVKSIEVSGLCTAHNLHDWFSHRAEKGKTGRFGVVMYLLPG